MAAGSDSPFYLKNERLIDVDPILQGDFVYHCHDPLQFAYKIMIGSHGNFEGPGNFQGPKLLTAPGIFQAAWKIPGPGNFHGRPYFTLDGLCEVTLNYISSSV